MPGDAGRHGARRCRFAWERRAASQRKAATRLHAHRPPDTDLLPTRDGVPLTLRQGDGDIHFTSWRQKLT